ncbi:MAG: NIF3 (NGG1p interacting factor 3)-like protein [Candidatus Gottesmanbacteria bacterium GW2011_GWB1_49_7]|uniref:NIF3 (NGG1p interacting factor 3)-like protein n=1 Tax=Candidatus Gottesmanbacteria bacterium GW2011_GWB1_49_7 TaxID=1618448 RepID=A0A0G1VYS3_9BACT|nr:MAG: NIF3 (NGG1p interacting factor 3)-like protein [Candidatus Gottesmanbacteria bacterium GW2011_GWB1_49_7]
MSVRFRPAALVFWYNILHMMTLGDIYKKAVEMAIAADPRGEEGVKKLLARRKKEYEDLPKSKKEEFDLEDLHNPYTDSRILLGDPDKKVDSILAGIDITSAEVVLADRLNEKGKSIDLILTHHPSGAPFAALHEVMDVQADVLAQYGVPINVAEGVMSERISEISRRISPKNHNQAVDAARLLGFAFMCTHTITDNLVHEYMDKLFTKKKAETVGDVLAILKQEPEYKEAMKGKAGPAIFAGDERNRAGRVAPIEFTGGTEASHIVYEKLAIAGVGTVVGMHAGEEHRKEALKYHINLVIAGHMSSDSLGMNLFLDELEKKGITITPCSGLIRVRRK